MRANPAAARPPDDWETVAITPGYDLRYRWNTDRERLNRSEVYQALLNSDGLLNPSFLDCAKKLIEHDFEISEALDLAAVSAKSYKRRHPPAGEDFRRLFGTMSRLGLPDLKLSPSGTPNDLLMRILRGKLTRVGLRKIMNQVLVSIVDVSEKIADQEIQLQALVGNDSVRFCSNTSAYICDCRTVQLGRKRPCDACGKIPRGFPTSINRVEPALVDIVINNRWLELAIARLFHITGFKTLIGAQVLGISGAEHEVDVIAYDPLAGLVICSEVSVGGANLNELADLLVRREDIHFHGATLVVLNSSDEYASRFAKAHGIGLFPQIRRNVKSLKSWVKNLRSSHSINPVL
jgi:hypothetical protein